MVSVPANVDAGARRRAVRHAPTAAGEASAETGGEPAARDSTDGLYAGADRLPARILATIRAARYHGVDLDPNEFRPANRNGAPSASDLADWAANGGMWARAVRVRFSHLVKLRDTGPVVLLFNDGGAGLLTGSSAERNVVYLKSVDTPDDADAVAIDEPRLSTVWTGEAVLVRGARAHVAADAPFSLRWLAELVRHESAALRDIAIASLTLSILTILPPLVVMTVVTRVLQFNSISTLALLSSVVALVFAYEALLGHARRLIVSVVGARLDTRLNLHVFSRLLRLPLDYFERHPAGETMYRLAQVYRIREFLTGKLLSTFLDLMTLCVLLPVMFFLSPPCRGSCSSAPSQSP